MLVQFHTTCKYCQNTARVTAIVLSQWYLVSRPALLRKLENGAGQKSATLTCPHPAYSAHQTGTRTNKVVTRH